MNDQEKEIAKEFKLGNGGYEVYKSKGSLISEPFLKMEKIKFRVFMVQGHQSPSYLRSEVIRASASRTPLFTPTGGVMFLAVKAKRIVPLGITECCFSQKSSSSENKDNLLAS